MTASRDNFSAIEAWAGEIRVNLVRLIAIVLFYSRHVVDFLVNRPTTPEAFSYHTRVTWVAGAWAAMVVLVHVRLVRRRVTPELKYATVIWDAAMITLLCAIAGGPRAPLVLLFFPLIATAPLRLSLRVVWVATASAILGYLCVLGHYAWYVVGFEKYYATPALRVPRSEEAMYVLAMLVAGLLAGQMVRQARRLAAGYPVTVVDAPPAEEETAATTTSSATSASAASGARTSPQGEG